MDLYALLDHFLAHFFLFFEVPTQQQTRNILILPLQLKHILHFSINVPFETSTKVVSWCKPTFLVTNYISKENMNLRAHFWNLLMTQLWVNGGSVYPRAKWPFIMQNICFLFHQVVPTVFETAAKLSEVQGPWRFGVTRASTEVWNNFSPWS